MHFKTGEILKPCHNKKCKQYRVRIPCHCKWYFPVPSGVNCGVWEKWIPAKGIDGKLGKKVKHTGTFVHCDKYKGAP